MAFDFNNLKEKFGELTKTATEKAKELGDKALEFAGDNLAKTALYIQSEDEYEAILNHEKVVLLAYDDRTEIEKDVLKLLPIWQTKSLIESSNFRYLTHSASEILIAEKGYMFPIEMRVFVNKNEILKLSSLEEIRIFWSLEFRDYKNSEKLLADFENAKILAKKSETEKIEKTEEKAEEKTSEKSAEKVSEDPFAGISDEELKNSFK